MFFACGRQVGAAARRLSTPRLFAPHGIAEIVTLANPAAGRRRPIVARGVVCDEPIDGGIAFSTSSAKLRIIRNVAGFFKHIELARSLANDLGLFVAALFDVAYSGVELTKARFVDRDLLGRWRR